VADAGQRDASMSEIVAERLRCLGVQRLLIVAAEAGRIDKLECQMGSCRCPLELGGRSYFEPVATPLTDWSPTYEHRTRRSQGGTRNLEEATLAHRLCNRIHAAELDGLSTRGDEARIKAALTAAIDGRWERTAGWSQAIADLLCVPRVDAVRAFFFELKMWSRVEVDSFFDRGSGPTGLRLFRGNVRFANIFPMKTLQFAHFGEPLVGFGLDSERHVSRAYQSISADRLPESGDEARLLAAYAYWRAGLSSGKSTSSE
jgi:hypothetical protein